LLILDIRPRNTSVKVCKFYRDLSKLVVLRFEFGGVKKDMSVFEMGPDVSGSRAGEVVAVVVNCLDGFGECLFEGGFLGGRGSG
jgi:hypothetical protein